ncbi:heavy metal-associated isoprenylated plant protein 35-like [Oryza brachyantha]|uniref:heavy metal-associated isoprenylated plant protein 35-like n=1 Tax=Oryza brachyantha TaxID=4533 RepID=UPI001ADC12C5|nr:heavy metal-associated isoprenylated plant protein 35-like [Oryza brachyantha]
MASESPQCKILALRVSIHCEGCKKKVKKVLQRVDGVSRCDVDGRSNKATVTVTDKVSADTLIGKLRRAGKHAEQWPEEEEEEQQQQSSGSQCPGETKNQAAEPDKSGKPVEPEKAASGDLAEPSDTKASPEESKKSAGEDAAPAEESGAENTDANAGDGGGGTATAQEHSELKRRRKQQKQKQPPAPQQEDKAGEATMAAATTTMQGSHTHTSHYPAAPVQQPVHVVSYNVARPMSSAACYAAAPAAAARPPPPQEHPDAYSTYHHSQPLPYRYGYYYNNYYYGGGHATPPRSAASPARNSYGDLFSDDNANSCSVM